MTKIYVDGNRIEAHENDPELRVEYQDRPAKNDAGGTVFVRAWWSRGHTSALEAGQVAKFKRDHPELTNAPVLSIRKEADTPGYGTCDTTVKW
jgi:hypothetical protein